MPFDQVIGVGGEFKIIFKGIVSKMAFPTRRAAEDKLMLLKKGVRDINAAGEIGILIDAEGDGAIRFEGDD